MDAAAIITALVGVLGVLGAGVRFIWNKLEARFQHIEAELEKCRVRELESTQRRSIQVTVIELLWQELMRHVPESPVFTRAKKLLDELKELGAKQDGGA